MSAQPGILRPGPPLARSLTFRMAVGGDPRSALRQLGASFSLGHGVVGVGAPLASALKVELPGLRTFPALSLAPSTQQALWVLLQLGDPTALFDHSEAVKEALAGGFVLDDAIDLFTYREGRDLSGYVDGTENPKEKAAEAAALRPDGSSFVAVQRWTHDLAKFKSFGPQQQDDVIGRHKSTNEEFAESPPSAHVKRAAQESYTPPAFQVRRSMPWATAHAQGLEFIAYGESLDRFERVLKRMVGLEDGILDGLFSFSKPVTGSYFWCPPAKGDRLELSALGL